MTTRKAETDRRQRVSPQEREPGPEGSRSYQLVASVSTATAAHRTEADAVRSMPEQFRTLFSGVSPDGSVTDRSTRRPGLGSPSAVERVLCLRDVFSATADGLERLSRDARPVHPHARLYDPVAGYHRWDLEEVLRTLAAEAQRLARVAEDLSTNEALPVDVRHGVESIAAELLRHALRYGAMELGEAELALRT